MSGEKRENNMVDLSEISIKLAELKTESEVRWEAHDKRSDENWQAVKEYMNSIETYLRASGTRRKECMDEARKYTDENVAKAVGLWLGIPVSVTALVSVIVVVAHYILRKA